jgi:hypothetical protein
MELLRHRNKSILAGDMNATHSLWNSAVSNPSSQKHLQMFGVCEFKISVPQYPTLYSSGKWCVLDIVSHQHPRLSHVIDSDILDSDHHPIVFRILDCVTNKLLEPFKKFIDRNSFRTCL